MKTYELTYIISSSLNQEEAQAVSKELEGLIQNNSGLIVSSEKLMIQTLAYPIKKQSSGYFSTLIFQIPEEKTKELKDWLEKNTKFLRYLLVIKKPVKALKPERVRRVFTVPRPQTIAESPYIKTPEQKEEVTIEEIEKQLDEL